MFEISLRKSLPDTFLKKRIMNIMDTLTYNVYNYGCTGVTLLLLLLLLLLLMMLLSWLLLSCCDAVAS